MGGWGGALMEGYNGAVARRRQERLDTMTEELQRGRTALAAAAQKRADALAQDKMANSGMLRDRVGYLDRLAVLKRDTAPFQGLLGKFPEAGASPYTTTATGLDERLARDPSLGGRQPPVSVPWAPDQQPTYGEERTRAIDSAYDKFGGANLARQTALAKLKAGMAKGPPPFTKDLDIKSRSIESRKKQAQALISGSRMNPQTGLMEILRPEELAAAKAQGNQMLAQLQAEEAAVGAEYQRRIGGGMTTPNLGPAATARQLADQGMEAAQVVEHLRQLYSDQELAAWDAMGQTGLEE